MAAKFWPLAPILGEIACHGHHVPSELFGIHVEPEFVR